MLYIAHRGLFKGPNSEKENHPDQIASAVAEGFDCEVDLWFNDNKFILGHDSPQYEITDSFLLQWGLWIHCKSLQTLEALIAHKRLRLTNYFWHENDQCTLTNHGYVWTYPGQYLFSRSIMVMPEYTNINIATSAQCHGICSDYVKPIRELRNNR